MLVAAVWSVMWPAVSMAVDLRVQGRTRLELDVSAAGTRAVIQGRLVDELGAALRQRTIDLQVTDSSGEAVHRTSVNSRGGGRFRESVELPPGEYSVTAQFTETTHLAGATASAEVELSSKPPSITLRAPSWVVGEEAEPMLRVGVSVGGVGIEVDGTLFVGESVRRAIVLDEDGRGRVPLGPMLKPGKNRLRVVIPSTQHRESASAERSVRFSPEVDVTATTEVGFSRFQRVLQVRGRVADTAGAISDVPLEVRLYRAAEGDSPAKTMSARTGASGQFQTEFSTSTLKDGAYRTVVEASPDAGPTVTAKAGEATLDRTLTRWVVDGAAGLAGMVVVILVGWRGWRAWRAFRLKHKKEKEREQIQSRAFETQEELEPVPLDGSERVGASDERGDIDPSRIRVQFWDVWRKSSVEDCAVHFESKAKNAESMEERTDEEGWVRVRLDDGRWSMEVDDPRFMPASDDIDIPHDGSYDGARVNLVAVPLKIRRLFESITSLLEASTQFGEKTPREIEAAVRDVLEARSESNENREEPQSDVALAQSVFARFQSVRSGDTSLETSADYIRSLTDILEESYYSPRSYGRDVWELAREIGDEIRSRAEQTSEDR